MICLSEGLVASLVLAAVLLAAVAGVLLVTARRALEAERADAVARLQRVNRQHQRELAAERELQEAVAGVMIRRQDVLLERAAAICGGAPADAIGEIRAELAGLWQPVLRARQTR